MACFSIHRTGRAHIALVRRLRPLVGQSARCPALWDFEKLDTLRRRLIQRAGRLIRPQGRLTLSMNANDTVQDHLLHYLDALDQPA